MAAMYLFEWIQFWNQLLAIKLTKHKIYITLDHHTTDRNKNKATKPKFDRWAEVSGLNVAMCEDLTSFILISLTNSLTKLVIVLWGNSL